jgi:hypothetical protein
MSFMVDKDGKILDYILVDIIDTVPEGMTHYVNGEFISIPEEVVEPLVLSEAEIEKNDVLSKLEKSDKQIIRAIEDLIKFCKGIGYIANINTRQLIKDRQDLRMRLGNINNR